MLKKEQMQFPMLEKDLEHQTTKAKKKFCLRPYREGDESGMLECIRDEYGESYFKRDFYDLVKLRAKAQGDHYVFFVAETDGEIVGMEIFALFYENGDDYIEPASQILKRCVRGYGLARELVEYTFPLAKAMKPSALFVHAVTFHDITQHVCGAQGMVATGFRLGSFLADRMNNSYPRGKCLKHSEGVMILPLEKKHAGKIFVSKELDGYIGKCYERLKMSYEICGKKEDYQHRKATLLWEKDELQRTVLIKVLRYGEDLISQIQSLMAQQREPYWTYQISLPVDVGQAITAYEQLKLLGFFFTGLKAACAQKEQIYMQWCGTMELYMEEYALTEQFQNVREHIQTFYDRRERE